MLNYYLPFNSKGIGTIEGKIINYSNTAVTCAAYRRSSVQKMIDAVLYGQRVEDCLHMFIVRMSNPDPLVGGTVDIPVNVHGTISGGTALCDHMSVRVTGRYKGNVLMARCIEAIDGGQSTHVMFQVDLRETLTLFLPAAILAVLMLGTAYGDGPFGSLALFVGSWMVVSGILAVLWFLVLSRLGLVALLLLRGRNNGGLGFPLLPILLIGLLITLAFW